MSKYPGSITVFFALLLTTMTSLICTSILSAKIAAGRAQIINSCDQALFSLFSQYDRDLQNNYGLFFIDGGMNTQSLQPGKCINYLEDAAEHIIDPAKDSILSAGSKLLDIEPEMTSITGYTLAGDNNASPFASQIIEYMKDTLGIQAVSSLKGYLSSNVKRTKEMEEKGRSKDPSDISGYLNEIENASDGSADSGNSTSVGASDGTVESTDSGTSALSILADPEETKNALGVLQGIKTVNTYISRSILDQVVGDPSSISTSAVSLSTLPSNKTLEQGVGTLDPGIGIKSAADKLLLNEYIISHCDDYLSGNSKSSLSYQTEYILCGKDNDRDNLAAIAQKLLLIRMGTNLAFLSTDPSLKGQAEATAAILSTLLLIPEAKDIFQTMILLCWSWCESITDLRVLYSGKKVALIKNGSNWQVPLHSIGSFLTNNESLQKNDPSGLSYVDYLRIFLTMSQTNTTIMRLMDMIESTIRTSCNRPGFRIDLCIDSMSIEMKMRCQKLISFTASRKYSYRDIDEAVS